jgi:hypothetical protein
MSSNWFCSRGEKVTAKAHGKLIDIQGIAVARVDDKVRLQSVEIWNDPFDMFRQIASGTVVSKTTPEPAPGQDLTTQLHGDYDEEQQVVIAEEMGSISSAECPFLGNRS